MPGPENDATSRRTATLAGKWLTNVNQNRGRSVFLVKPDPATRLAAHPRRKWLSRSARHPRPRGVAASSAAASAIGSTAATNTLTAGAGADRFIFDTPLNAAANVDTITDFSPAQGDRIILSETDFPSSVRSVPRSRPSIQGLIRLRRRRINTSLQPRERLPLCDQDGSGSTRDPVHFAHADHAPGAHDSGLLGFGLTAARRPPPSPSLRAPFPPAPGVIGPVQAVGAKGSTARPGSNSPIIRISHSSRTPLVSSTRRRTVSPRSSRS